MRTFGWFNHCISPQKQANPVKHHYMLFETVNSVNISFGMIQNYK